MSGIAGILEMQNPEYYKIIHKNIENRQKISMYYRASGHDPMMFFLCFQ